MQALGGTAHHQAAVRILYASLFAGYLLLVLITPRGPSEGGWIRPIEYAPLLVLLVQVARPLRAIWWLVTVASGLYGALLIFEFARIHSLGPHALFRLLALIWVCVVLVFDRNTGSVLTSVPRR